MPSLPDRLRRFTGGLPGLVALTALAGLTALPFVQASSNCTGTVTSKTQRFQLSVPYDFSADLHGHKFITRTQGARLAAERLGATLIADYGSFQLYHTSHRDTSALEKLDGLEWADEFNVVHLNIPINTTSRGAQELAQQRLRGSGKHLHVVQFAGPARREWFAALQATGVRVINYLPYNAYLVYGDAASIERISGLGGTIRQAADTTTNFGSFKQWDGPYLADFKLDPSTAEVALQGT